MTSDQEFSALLAFVQSESRICPMPIQWNELWNMLPGKPKYAGNVEPYPPLVLAGWWASTNDQKAERFAYHIRWAHQHGAFEQVNRFLRNLPIQDWHHSDPSKPSF